MKPLGRERGINSTGSSTAFRSVSSSNSTTSQTPCIRSSLHRTHNPAAPLPCGVPGKPLTVYGDGTQTRSFQYVSDLINGMVTVMEGEHIGPFNIGNPGEFTMLELVSSGVGTAVQQIGEG